MRNVLTGLGAFFASVLIFIAIGKWSGRWEIMIIKDRPQVGKQSCINCQKRNAR